MASRICVQCGKTFEVPKPSYRKNCCSQECRYQSRRKRVSRTCKNCGKAFDITPWKLSQGRGNYCSMKCNNSVTKPNLHSIRRNEFVDCGEYIGIILRDRNGRTKAMAKIDHQDLAKVSEYTWHALKISYGTYTAVSTMKKNKRKIHVYMHRLITDAPEGSDVDHINHDTLDDRRSNLRLCSRAENLANRRPKRRDLPLGVLCHKDGRRLKYVANLAAHGKSYRKGFATIEEAVAQRKEWEQELFGEFAYEASLRQAPEPVLIAPTI